MQLTVRKLPVNGAELHCEARGEGPTCLVLCHLGAKTYEKQIPVALSKQLRLVFVELRGSGRSTGEPSDLSFDVLAEDLDSVRRAYGVERVSVLGHSIVGMLAIEYARRRPESVSHAIVVGTPPHGDMAKLAARANAFFALDASEERKRALRQNLTALPEKASPGEALLASTPQRFFDPHFDAAVLYADTEPSPAFFAHLLGELAPSWSVMAAATALEVPLLIALGRCDYVVPRDAWQGVVERLPRATLEVFDESGHQPFLEEPAAFAKVVLDWMRRTR